MKRRTTAAFLAALVSVGGVPASVPAALDAPGEVRWDGSQPVTGVYFHWYEPSFYTGFAPRCQDASRIHTELGRGNQQRVTVALGDAELDAYLGDLEQRRRTVEELVSAGVMKLATNKAFERYVAGLEAQGVAAAVAARATTPPEAWRRKAVDVMAALNPGRVFRIRMPLGQVAARWHAVLAATDAASSTARLDAAVAVLPGRVHLTALVPAHEEALARAMAAARAGGADSAAFRTETAAFVAAATKGHYRVAGDAVEAVEFTAIYPAGTADATTMYKGEKLPDFGVTGTWPLTRREKGKGQLGMADYLSTNPGYGFIPLLAYQYAGGIAYNAFHNAGVRCELGSTPFLPAEWRKATSERDGKPMQNLWIVGRGPTSHGCTRLPSGHMGELRQLVPSESDDIVGILNFRNLPQCYDVFDIDGDGRDEVMGVQYYLSYRSNDHTPVRASAPNRREPFYQWLYGSNVEIGPVGSARIREAPTCRFVGRKAEEKALRRDVPLYEAAFEPEALQFYTITRAAFDSPAGFDFNRELRKVGAGHVTNRKLLFLP